MTASDNDPDQIERDLERTRERMDDRLSQLEERLTPGQLLNDGLASLSRTDGADFTRDLLARARSNPAPVLVAGVGLAWLFLSERKAAQPDLGRDARLRRRRLAAVERQVSRGAGEADDAFGLRLNEARGDVLEVRRVEGESPQAYSRRVADALTDLHAGGAHVDEQGAARAGSRRAITGPLAIGGLAASVGAVLGALLPTTRTEENLLGGTATRARDAGVDMAQAVVDRAAHVAGAAVQAGRASAESGAAGPR